ncbi:MAG TPA: ABC transporter permease [Bryobacteraceae bacterium]|jgi:lipopolysaccharide transport system permease protein|nr:ABC transporter permease [Bryobacteraceae bacterium]
MSAARTNAAFESPDVRLRGPLDVEARFNLRNTSSDSWRPGEGFAAGFHIYDSDSGTLVVDGERQAPPADVAPGASVPVDLHFALPPESGRYDVFISPMREDVCWFYTRGWPFLRVQAIVEDGRARLERVRVVTLRTIRRENLLRAVGRAFTLPIATIVRNRSLIRTMVRRDILGRYRGSFGGVYWTILNPLLLMLTYYFVFGMVLQARFGNDPSRAGFALYFLAGMLPWLPFSEAAGRAPTVMMEHRNFVKKLVFAVETLPVNLVVSGLVTEVFALLLFTIGVFLARGRVPASVVWLPVLLVPQVLFAAGVCWFLGALGVFVRDLGQVIGFLLTLWFFLTPICYPEASLPKAALPLLQKNPMFVLVRGYRAIFLEGHAPMWGSLWKLWIAAAAVFILGHAWFYKLRRSFADII